MPTLFSLSVASVRQLQAVRRANAVYLYNARKVIVVESVTEREGKRACHAGVLKDGPPLSILALFIITLQTRCLYRYTGVDGHVKDTMGRVRGKGAQDGSASHHQRG